MFSLTQVKQPVSLSDGHSSADSIGKPQVQLGFVEFSTHRIQNCFGAMDELESLVEVTVVELLAVDVSIRLSLLQPS